MDGEQCNVFLEAGAVGVVAAVQQKAVAWVVARVDGEARSASPEMEVSRVEDGFGGRKDLGSRGENCLSVFVKGSSFLIRGKGFALDFGEEVGRFSGWEAECPAGNCGPATGGA